MSKKQEETKSVRQYDLDFLRVIAIAAVVLIHCIAAVQFKPVNSAAWMTTNLLDSFIHWCVPVFVMISGALLINERAYKDTGGFFKKRFSRSPYRFLFGRSSTTWHKYCFSRRRSNRVNS